MDLLGRLSIRPARPGDEATLQPNCLSGSSLEDVRRGIAWAAAEDERGTLTQLVADLDGEIVGTVTLMPYPSIVRARPDGSFELVTRGAPPFLVGELAGWSVYHRYWRRGIGRALFESLRELARTRGMRRLVAGTYTSRAAAMEALARVGFSEWGRLPVLEPAGDRAGDEVWFHIEV